MRFWYLLIVLLVHNSYVFGVTLTGTVTRSDTNAVVAGALVLVRGTSLLGVSGTDGTYSLEVPAGVYGLTCTASGLRHFYSSAIDLSQNTTRNFNLNPTATGTYSITGTATCTTTTSTPCGGVLVLVYSGETLSAVGLSAADTGSYSAEGLAEGTYSLTAVAFGYLPQRQADFVVAASGTPAFDPVLTAGLSTGSVTGFVGLADNPLDRSGSTVRCNGTALASPTSANGSYSLLGVPAGLLSFSASHPGYNQSNHIDVFVEDKGITLNFALSQGSGQTTPTYRINGRITLDAAADGTTPSLSNSLVNIWTTDESQHFSGITDVDGNYSIENLPEGNYKAGASREGYVTQFLGPFDLTANQPWSVQLAVNSSWDYGPGGSADLPGCSVSSSNGSLWLLLIGLLILLFSPPRT